MQNSSRQTFTSFYLEINSVGLKPFQGEVGWEDTSACVGVWVCVYVHVFCPVKTKKTERTKVSGGTPGVVQQS